MENILFVYENQLPDNFSENVEKAGITPKVATPGDELNFDKIDAVAYFGENKDNLKTVVEKAVESGVKRAVYVASAICYFNRHNPGQNLENIRFGEKSDRLAKTQSLLFRTKYRCRLRKFLWRIRFRKKYLQSAAYLR